MKRMFLFLIACLLPLLPLQAFQLIQETVLHKWFEPHSAIPIMVKGKKNNNVMIRPYEVSTSKEAYIKKYILNDGRTWYVLNGTATASASAEVFHIRGNAADYDATAWAELTGDKNILAPPNYTNITMGENKDAEGRNYKYGELEDTKTTTNPHTKTTAKAVKKKHPVTERKKIFRDPVIRNFYLGDDVTKSGGLFQLADPFRCEPVGKNHIRFGIPMQY